MAGCILMSHAFSLVYGKGLEKYLGMDIKEKEKAVPKRLHITCLSFGGNWKLDIM